MEIRRTTEDGILTIALDDGKMNVLNTDVFNELGDAFDDAGDARAIVLTGREGVLSAGLDRKALEAADRDGLHTLLTAFGRTLMRIWTEPRPVVTAATGHALAAGTMLALASDHAVAADGPYAWGLTETQINFQLPMFGIMLARHSVRADRLEDLLLPGAKVDPETAVEAGFADELATPDEVVPQAMKKAAELGQLPPAYGGTKRRLRGHHADAILASLDDDIEALVTAALPD